MFIGGACSSLRQDRLDVRRMIAAELAQYPSEPHYPRRKRVTAFLDLSRQKVDQSVALVIGEVDGHPSSPSTRPVPCRDAWRRYGPWVRHVAPRCVARLSTRQISRTNSEARSPRGH